MTTPLLQRFLKADDGVDLVEWSLIGFFIAIAALPVLPSLLAGMKQVWSAWGNDINNLWIPRNPQ